MGEVTTVRTDLVVIGETMAGVCAAVRATAEGLRVVITCTGSALGGSFPSLGALETHFPGVRAPLIEEFRNRVKSYYRTRYGEDSPQYQTCVSLNPQDPFLTFEPHVAREIIEGLVSEQSNITVLRGVHPVSVERAGRTLNAVTVAAFSDGTRTRLEARVFVDASDEGDFAALAGVPYRVGRESRTEYGETHAGRIFTQWLHGKFPIDAAEGRLRLYPKWTTMGLFSGSTGEGDHRIQAYSYRVCLTDDPANRLPIERPPAYDRAAYLAIAQSPDQYAGVPYALHNRFLTDSPHDMVARDHIIHGHPLPNRKRSWNAATFPGANYAYPEADWETRRAIARQHRDHALGILYFMQNDPDMPEDLRASARQWGLAADEFTESAGFPDYIYAREGRRIVGRYTFTEYDASLAPGKLRAPTYADSIAFTDFPLDSLACSAERRPGTLPDGQMFLMEQSRPGCVPYRVLLPEHIDNLLVAVCVSVTHVAWGVLRQNTLQMHIGEVVGFAAVLALESGTSPGQLDIDMLQRRLLDRGVMICFFNDVDMTTDARWVSAVQWCGARGFFDSYDALPDAAYGDDLTRAQACQRLYDAHFAAKTRE
ncbi:MAG: FAD-dependent oxidoreductase [Chloroflexi bacterium]|nr:FAD-dependent oxidoreductase [Chloroflexota bacterium]